MAQYRVHYEDGSQHVIPVVNGEDVRDWWNIDQDKPVTRGRVVWTGLTRGRRNKLSLRVYLGMWENGAAGQKGPKYRLRFHEDNCRAVLRSDDGGGTEGRRGGTSPSLRSSH